MPVLRLELRIDLEKSEIKDIFVDNPSPGEICVKAGSDYAKKLEGLAGSNVSFALVANPHERFRGAQRYIIGFISQLNLRLVAGQSVPIRVGFGIAKREKKMFRNNRIYGSYSLYVISPPLDEPNFFSSHGALASYATPDS